MWMGKMCKPATALWGLHDENMSYSDCKNMNCELCPCFCLVFSPELQISTNAALIPVKMEQLVLMR